MTAQSQNNARRAARQTSNMSACPTDCPGTAAGRVTRPGSAPPELREPEIHASRWKPASISPAWICSILETRVLLHAVFLGVGDRLRILAITPRPLYPANTGGRIRPATIRERLAREHDITLLCFRTAADDPAQFQLMRACCSSLEGIP